ncbi:MAG: aminopeptidase P family protein [Deltaproteobacteria bacterium]|nr:aminopeptidase P family protein [Deltaproteobacteria bacterium]
MTRIVEPITTSPSKEELDLRINKIRSMMAKEELDFYVSAHTDNVYYLTNFAYLPFERPFFLIVQAEGKPQLVVPLLEVSHAEQRILIEVDYHTYYEYPAPVGKTFGDTLNKLIGSDKTVGIESSLSIALQKTIPGKGIVTDLIDDARLVKTDYEVGRIAYASSVVELGLKKVLEQSKPDVQVATLYSAGNQEMLVKVLFEIPDVNMLMTKFVAAVWPKAISAQPHSVPGLFDGLEKGGPNVAIITAQANGYSAELERTYFIETISDEARNLFDLSMEARQKAYELIKPGVRGDDVDRQVLQIIKDAGYGDKILHRTGHGFGITGHEPPWVALGSEHVLEKNMVISIEPGIYVEGVGGFRHSDTVLVTANGCESLTQYPDKLEDLILSES